MFGGSIGIAVSFIVLNSRIQNTLGTALSPQQLSDFYKSPAVTATFDPLQQYQVRETYIRAFVTDMRICLGVASGSMLAALFSYQRKPLTMTERLEALEKLYVREGATPPSPDV